MFRNRATPVAVFSALALSFALSAGPTQARDPLPQGKGTGSLFIAFQEEVDQAEARSIARQSGFVDGVWLQALQTLAVSTGPAGLTSQSAATIQSNRAVRFLEANPSLSATTAPDDTSYGQQWAPARIGAEAAWDMTMGSAGVVVAVLDTGLDPSHPEFAGKTIAGWDFFNNDADPSDDNGHGTHVAGVAGALTNNALGIASIGRATTIMPVKVLNQYAGGNHATAASGVLWAVDNGARIINLSLGSAATSATLESAINYAFDHGVLVVAAAGNGNTATPFYPAAYVNTMAIGGTDSVDARYSMSNFGTWLDMMAPGVSIYSTNWGPSAYNTRTGTSQAAPHVSAVAALMLALDDTLTPTYLRDMLQSSALDLGAAGLDTMFGYGRLDAAAAVVLAGGVPPPNTPTATSVASTATPLPPTATPLPPTATPQPPVIGSVNASPVGNTTARVNWTTNIGASSRVEYGLTTSYGNATAFDGTLVTTHSQDIVGLTRHTTYHYRVRSIANGVEAIGTDRTFKTK